MIQDIEVTKINIKIGILDLQQNGLDLFLMAYCGVFGVEIEEIKNPSLGDKLIHSIQQMLGDNCSENMLAAVLEATEGMIENSKFNFQTVSSYQSVLFSKQRSLTGRNAYGDIDSSKWLNFASQFAIDKLKGYIPLKLFIELSATPQQTQHLVQIGLADMFGLYTRQMLELIKYFSRDETQNSPMTGEEYEELLREKIEDRFPNSHIEPTPKSGDQGVDLVVDIDSTRIAIQAKYYKSSVGNAAVQEAHAGKGFCQADHAMVVCDSNFTRHAKELAEKLDVHLETTQSFLDRIDILLDGGHR